MRVIDGGLPTERRRERRTRTVRRDGLVADVQRCRAIKHALRLATWIGPGRDLEPDGSLPSEDAAAAVRLLGLPRLASGRASSWHEHDELNASWATALGAGFLRQDGTRVALGQGMLLWRANSGSTRRDLWLRAFCHRTGLDDPGEPAGTGGGVTPQGSAAMIALRLLYEAPDGLPVPDTVGTIGEVLAAIPCSDPEDDEDVALDPVDGLVLLEDFGALAMPGDRVALGPLGRYLGDSVLYPESRD